MLAGLAVSYKARRDFYIDALADEFNLRTSVSVTGSWTGCVVYTASKKSKRFEMSEKFGGKDLFSFVAPSAGMFIWMKLHFENVPGFRAGEEDTMEMKLWQQLAEAGVLVGPGSYFAAEQDGVSPVEGHFRISFSFASVRTPDSHQCKTYSHFAINFS